MDVLAVMHLPISGRILPPVAVVLLRLALQAQKQKKKKKKRKENLAFSFLSLSACDHQTATITGRGVRKKKLLQILDPFSFLPLRSFYWS
jgi:hypothetical protein